MLKRINQKWLYLDSFSVFYVDVFILFFIFLIFNSLIIYQIASCIFALLFIYRFIYRYKKINTFTYYSINEDKQVCDQKMRGYQLGDVVAIIMNLLICLTANSNFMNQYENSLLWLVVFYSIFYFAFGSLSIIKNKMGWRILCILMSTMQGLMLCLFLMVEVLSRITSLLEGKNWDSILFMNDSTIDLIIGVGFVFEKVPIFTVVIILVSILLYIILIIGTPVYQQEQLTYSFKIVAIVITLCSIITFFLIDRMTPEILKHVNNNINDINKSKEIFNGAQIEYISYYKSYSKGNISSFFYLLLLPYTFGILVAYSVIDFVKRKNVKYINESFKIISNKNKDYFDCNKDYNLKKYLYYGGDKWRIEISVKQLELEEMLFKFNNNSSI